MQCKPFGETGVSVGSIGQGTTGMGTKHQFLNEYIQERIKALRLGIDLGMTFVDTASLYGNGFSEEVVGIALKGIREKCFLATKFYPHEKMDSQDISLALETSLENLQTQWVDLYQIHWPNPRVNLEKVFEVLEKYRARGVIRFFGICNFSPQEFCALEQSIPHIPFSSNEIEFNLQAKRLGSEFLNFSSFKGAILGYSPLNKGRMVGTELQANLIRALAERYRATPSQIVLAWILSFKRVFPIVKAATCKHVEENAEAMALALSNEDIQQVSDSWKEFIYEAKPESIKLRGTPKRKPYLTLEEAIENPLDLVPSPVALAESIVKYDLKMPIQVVPFCENNDLYEYEVDPYDPFDQVKKYWAWKIAFPGKLIPVCISGPCP
ncbi:aldo/keto reductase [uncultured Nitrospira sp.]|uniref:aldo/keto reductase n=1 Tax=uncultured Nitrospira sp. TaxID=157176 RepID=UPI00314023DF